MKRGILVAVGATCIVTLPALLGWLQLPLPAFLLFPLVPGMFAAGFLGTHGLLPPDPNDYGSAPEIAVILFVSWVVVALFLWLLATVAAKLSASRAG